MNKLFILVVMLLMGTSMGNGQSKSEASRDAKAEQALRKLEREWLDAGRNKDGSLPGLRASACAT